MSYQVIARRYRPQTFEDVIGQEHVSKALAHAIEKKRYGHAYLFSGPRGTGKTSTARILAKALNCAKGPTAIPCNECPACKSITEGSNIDVIEIDAASNRGIDDARQLREYVQLAPSGQSKFRVYIIDEVHMLTTEAFNALLKTLEEPPSHAMFILATTEKHKVPITIISRCQQYDFKHITSADIIKQLTLILDNEKNTKTAKGEKENILEIIARVAKGSMRDAESVLEQLISFSGGELSLEKTNSLLGQLPSELISKLVDTIISENSKDALDNMASLLEQGIEFEQMCNELLDYFRSLAVLLVVGKDTTILDLVDEERERRFKQSGQFKPGQLIQMMKLCTHSIEQIRKTVPGRVVMDLLVLDCIQAKQSMPLPDIINELKALQKLVSSGAARTVETISVPRISGGSDVYTMPVLEESSTAIESENEYSEPPANPEPVQVGELSLDNLQANWGTIQEMVRENKPSLATVMGETIPVKLDQNIITLALDKEHKFHKSMLDKAENKEAIESVLLKLYGSQLRIKAEASGVPVIKKTVSIPVVKANVKPQIQGDGDRDPIVQKAIEIFGATNVVINRKSKIQSTEDQEDSE